MDLLIGIIFFVVVLSIPVLLVFYLVKRFIDEKEDNYEKRDN